MGWRCVFDHVGVPPSFEKLPHVTQVERLRAQMELLRARRSC
jgi:hypothetical protein